MKGRIPKWQLRELDLMWQERRKVERKMREGLMHKAIREARKLEGEGVMEEIRIMKDGSLFQALLEGGKQTGSFMTVDTALLALLFVNGDKLDAWTRSRLAVLADDYGLDKEIAPADVVGLKITIGEGCVNIEQIKKQFQFPPEATNALGGNCR